MPPTPSSIAEKSTPAGAVGAVALSLLAYLTFDALSHGRLDVQFGTFLSVTAAATVVLLGCIIVGGLRERPAFASVRRWPSAAYAVLAFAGYVLLSAVTIGSRVDVSFAKNAIIVVGVVMFVREARSAAYILGAAAIAGLAQAGVGALQFMREGMPPDGLTGYLPNHVQYGLYLAVALFALAGLVPAATTRARIAMGVAGAALLAGVIASGARGVVLAAVAAVVFSAAVLSRNKVRVAQAAVAAIAALAALLVVSKRYATIAALPAALSDIHALDKLLSQRLSLLMAAWNMFIAHPIIGAGYGAFAAGWWEWAPKELLNPWSVGVPRAAHSTYLQILAELGVVGCALYIAVIVAACVLAVRTFRTAGADVLPRGIAAAVLAVLLLFAFHGILDNAGWHDRVFYVFVGLAIVSPVWVGEVTST